MQAQRHKGKSGHVSATKLVNAPNQVQACIQDPLISDTNLVCINCWEGCLYEGHL